MPGTGESSVRFWPEVDEDAEWCSCEFKWELCIVSKEEEGEEEEEEEEDDDDEEEGERLQRRETEVHLGEPFRCPDSLQF